MKRIVLIVVLLLLIVVAITAWIFLGPATSFDTSKKALYIRSTAATKEAVLDSLKKNKIISNKAAFNFLANRLNYWKNIKPGKYEIKKGSSLLSIIRMLRNGRQTPVNLVITKIRTKEDFARMIGNKFETDSLQMIKFLDSPDSLERFDTDTASSMWNIIPDTYSYKWNSSPSAIYEKIYDASKKFWNEDRKQKAENLGISPLQAYILASIV